MFMETVGLLASVILFLYGIEQLSREMLRQASEKFREAISRLASNILAGTAAGAIITSIIQSSAATTVIAVGLVNAGIITFRQSLGVIAGANIGTTVTAQLVAFDMMKFGPLFMVLGFLVSIFGREFRFLGKGIFFFGLIFFALTVISIAIEPFRSDAALVEMIFMLDDPLYGVVAGALLTTILQSSSVVTGLAVMLTMSGIVTPAMAIPIVLGSNIGTTSTALIASSRMDLFAKRAAAAHTLFNILGVVLIFPFLPQFSEFVADMGGSGGSIVANAHMIFNVVAALVFILISNQVAALIERAVPGKEHEIVFRTRYLDKVPKATDAAIKAAVMESEHQLEIVKEMFDTSTDMLVRHDARGMSRVEKLKALNDFLDRKVSSLLAEVSLRKLSNGQSSEIIMVSRISYELKKLGNAGYDYAALAARLDEKNIRLSAESCRDLASIKEGFDSILALLARNIRRMDRDKVAEMDAMRREIDAAISLAHRHRIELISSATAGTEAVLVFLDAITALDHSNSALIRIGRLLASRKPR